MFNSFRNSANNMVECYRNIAPSYSYIINKGGF